MNIQVSMILELLKSQWENIPKVYMILIYFIGTVFAVLNCFMGYRLRKVWGCLLGILAGAGIGGVAGYFFLQDKAMALVCAGAGAMILGLLAWLLYKFGVFVMCTGLVYTLIIGRFADPTSTNHMVAIIVGVFAGTFALGYEKQMVIAITSICGGFGGIHLLLAMTGKDAGGGELILGLIMAGIGAVVQASALTKGSDWEAKVFGLSAGRKKRGIPGAGKKKAVKKTKVTYADDKQRAEYKKPVKKNRKIDIDEYDREEAEEYYNPSGEKEDLEKTQEYTIGQRQYEMENRRSSAPYLAPGIGIDLDDLNRELSQEIKKIYNDDGQN